MNSHCMQIIQMVKKNNLQIYTNSSLPNSNVYGNNQVRRRTKSVSISQSRLPFIGNE